jgi:hypothetical protein
MFLGTSELKWPPPHEKATFKALYKVRETLVPLLESLAGSQVCGARNDWSLIVGVVRR